ncbi:MAG: hypothetical protein ABR998_10395 [Gemmatimonadales bacterium]|jgi:hypothetical protein
MGARDRRLDAIASRLGAAEELGALVMKRRPGASLEPYAKYRDDALAFVTTVLHGKPTAQQREVIAAVQAERRVIVQAGFGVGKDWVGSALGLWWCYSRGGLVVICGPVERTVRGVIMQNEVRRFWTRAALPGTLFEMALRLDAEGNAGLVAFTSTSESNLTGWHSPAGVLLLVTEAQGILDAPLLEALLSNVSGAEDKALVYGNPVTSVTPFYGLCHSAAWHRIRLSCLDHPNISGVGAPVPGAVSPQYLERIGAEYGQDSAVWQARVLGEFPTADEGEGLCARADVERAFALHDAKTFAADAAAPVFSLDVARFGSDDSCLAVLRGRHVERIVTWHGLDTMASARRVLAVAEEFGRAPAWVKRFGAAYRAQIAVDETGVGGGVVDKLKELDAEPWGFNGGRRARDPKRFFNLRAEAFWTVRQRLEAGTLALPRDTLLAEELVAMRWRLSPLGAIQIEDKELLRGRIGRSPDRSDAVAMALAYGVRPTASVFTVLI